YGRDQVQRYLAALDRLPEERRAGLIAVTRNVPTYGEPRLDSNDGWLGSVRWAHISSDLRGLPVADDQLRTQWQLFVDVLEDQGDQANGHYGARAPDPSDYIHAPHVPSRLMEHIEQDVPVQVASGILDHDVDATLHKERSGPPRDRKAPLGA